MNITVNTNFDWVLRICDHVRYHEDRVDMGISKRLNPAFVEEGDLQPKYIFGAAWFLDACGFELCFEIIDTSFTVHRSHNELYELNCVDWGFSFRWGAPEYVPFAPGPMPRKPRDHTFQGRLGTPKNVRLWGDLHAFERAKALLEIVLPLREDVYYTRSPIGMANVDTSQTDYAYENSYKFAGGIKDLEFFERRKRREDAIYFANTNASR